MRQWAICRPIDNNKKKKKRVTGSTTSGKLAGGRSFHLSIETHKKMFLFELRLLLESSHTDSISNRLRASLDVDTVMEMDDPLLILPSSPSSPPPPPLTLSSPLYLDVPFVLPAHLLLHAFPPPTPPLACRRPSGKNIYSRQTSCPSTSVDK